MKNQHSNTNYNRSLKPLASTMRNNATKSEVCLWKFVLSRKKMKGYIFKRQRPVLNYIADFFCQSLKLIIEVDGMTHDDWKVEIKDSVRDKRLGDEGFKVVHFTAREVLMNIKGVRNAIELVVEEMERSDNINGRNC